MSLEQGFTLSLLAATVACSSYTQLSNSANLPDAILPVTSADASSLSVAASPASPVIPTESAAPASRSPETTRPRPTRPASTPTRTIRDRITNPEVAARGLYEAWKAGDRAKALKSASQAAVNRLFAQPWTSSDLQFMGCNNRDAGFDCFYYYEGGGLNLRVEGGASAGYRVESVEFIVD